MNTHLKMQHLASLLQAEFKNAGINYTNLHPAPQTASLAEMNSFTFAVTVSHNDVPALMDAVCKIGQLDRYHSTVNNQYLNATIKFSISVETSIWHSARHLMQ